MVLFIMETITPCASLLNIELALRMSIIGAGLQYWTRKLRQFAFM